MENIATGENLYWLIWLGVGVAFILAELASLSFIMIFFGIGALIAGATAFFGFSIPVQIVVFGVASLVLLILLRRVMASTFRGTSQDGDAQDDPAVGAQVLVSEEIVPPRRGRVKYQGTFWAAESSQPLAAGDTARIVGRHPSDKNTFLVEKES